jgi:hypothetical protein
MQEIGGPTRECHVALSDWPNLAKGIKLVGSNGNRTHDLWGNIPRIFQ